MSLQVAAILTIAVLAFGTMEFAAAKGGDDRTRLEAKLNEDGGDGSGKAKFEERDDRTRISIEIEDVPLECENYSATIDGAAVGGTFILEDDVCDLNLDDRDGDTVLSAEAGDEVIVTGNGVTLTGTLQNK